MQPVPVIAKVVNSLGTPVSSTNKTDHHEIVEILLNVVLNTITLTINLVFVFKTVDI